MLRAFGLGTAYRPAQFGKLGLCLHAGPLLEGCAAAVPRASPSQPAACPQVLWEETNGDAIITTGVGQHQMWAAQWYKYTEPRRWGSLYHCVPSGHVAADLSAGPHSCARALCRVTPDCTGLAAHLPCMAMHAPKQGNMSLSTTGTPAPRALPRHPQQCVTLVPDCCCVCPVRWASSGGLGSMGFGLPAAIGAAVAWDGTDKGRPKKVSGPNSRSDAF